MKLSELIEKLQKDLSEKGDCDVCVKVEWCGYDDDESKTSEPWKNIGIHREPIEEVDKEYNVIVISGSA